MIVKILQNLLLLLTIYNSYSNAQNYEVVFEKAELLGYNKDYGTLGTFNFRKINRTAFALNCTFTASRDVDLNDARIRLEASKFYSNKYVLVPTRLNFMLCKAWKENLFGIQNLKKNSNIRDLCYIKKNASFKFENYMPSFKYPPYAPFGRYRLGINLDVNDVNVISMAWYVQLTPK